MEELIISGIVVLIIIILACTSNSSRLKQDNVKLKEQLKERKAEQKRLLFSKYDELVNTCIGLLGKPLPANFQKITANDDKYYTDNKGIKILLKNHRIDQVSILIPFWLKTSNTFTQEIPKYLLKKGWEYTGDSEEEGFKTICVINEEEIKFLNIHGDEVYYGEYYYYSYDDDFYDLYDDDDDFYDDIYDDD